MAKVELRAFGPLMKVFSHRGWPFPLHVEIAPGDTPETLFKLLEIPEEQVEVVFVNGRVEKEPSSAGWRPGGFCPAGHTVHSQGYAGVLQQKGLMNPRFVKHLSEEFLVNVIFGGYVHAKGTGGQPR